MTKHLASYLSVITSAVYADALAVATSELVCNAGTQLKFNAENRDQNYNLEKKRKLPGCLAQCASVVCGNPRMKTHRQLVLVLHSQGQVGVVLVPKLPGILLLIKC